MAYTAADVKTLREETGAGMMDCKKALDSTDGDMEKAKEILREQGLAKAAKKADRETNVGYIASYVHSNFQVGAMVEILCETDFVARNSEFQDMAKEVAMQVVAMAPENVEELLAQDALKQPGKTINDIVLGLSAKIGEKFVVNRFTRYAVGE
jgi:elongation factor Ts